MSNFTQKHTFLLKCTFSLYANSDSRGIPVRKSAGFFPMSKNVILWQFGRKVKAVINLSQVS